jgi:tetratricopeptide (TPR) repeat protein
LRCGRSYPLICRNALAVFCASVVLAAVVPAHADEAAWRNFMTAAADSAQSGDHNAAAAMLEDAIKHAETFGGSDPRLAAALYAMGRAKRGLHDYVPAEVNYLRALGILENAGPGARQQSAAVLNGLGEIRQLQGRLADAESYYTRELGLLEQISGADHPAVAFALSNNLAALYRAQARNDEVVAVYKRVLAILEKSVPPNDSRLGLALTDLAEWYMHLHRYPEAEAYYRRGIPIMQATFPPAHARVLYLIQDWGQVNQLQGRYGEAERIYKMLLAIVEKAYGERHPSVAAALNNLVGVYQMQGRQAEAAAARKRMLELGNTQFRGQPYVPDQGLPPRRR